jgi:hypothetical protein
VIVIIEPILIFFSFGQMDLANNLPCMRVCLWTIVSELMSLICYIAEISLGFNLITHTIALSTRPETLVVFTVSMVA